MNQNQDKTILATKKIIKTFDFEYYFLMFFFFFYLLLDTNTLLLESSIRIQ